MCTSRLSTSSKAANATVNDDRPGAIQEHTIAAPEDAPSAYFGSVSQPSLLANTAHASFT